jgi:toxin ParE1/3/4
MRVELRRQAAEDLGRAARWYDDQRRGLGEAFLQAAEARIARLASHPRAGSIVERMVRRVLVERFPYCIFYVVEPERLVVLAVLHVARDPDLWPK